MVRCRSWVVAAIALTIPLLAPAAPAAARSPGDARCAGRVATIVGTRATDHLTGTSGRDVIVGRGGNDTIRGAGKDDVLCGGPGADVILGGGDRKRRYEWQWIYYGDTVVGGAGDDRIWGDRRARVAPGADEVLYTHAPRGVTVTLHRHGRSADGVARGQGHDRLHTIGTVRGSPHADELASGRARGTSLHGGPGRDRLSGSSLHGDRGDDQLLVRGGGADGGRGHDRIVASGVDLDLRGGADDDVIRSDADETEFAGGQGADRLIAERGHNGFDPGRGSDTIIGGSGPDLVYDADGSDTVRLRGGSDTVHLSAVPTTVTGGGGKDALVASDIGRAKASRLIIDLRIGRLSQGGTRASVAEFERVTGAESVPNTIIGTGRRERLIGGCRSDTIDGRGGDDHAFPLAGDDKVRTGRGDDVVDETEISASCAQRADDDVFAGGAGADLFRLDRWGTSPTAVLVDLAAGTSNAAGVDSLRGLENVRGGNHDAETIIGDAGPNVIDGGLSAGDDVRGRGGDDILRARGEAGRADGGDGTDTCHAATTVSCEN